MSEDKLKPIIEHMNWIHNRLIAIHGERSHVDYMARFSNIIDHELPDLFANVNSLSPLEKQWLDQKPEDVEGREILFGETSKNGDHAWVHWHGGYMWRTIAARVKGLILSRQKSPAWTVEDMPNGDVSYDNGELYGRVPKDIVEAILAADRAADNAEQEAE